MKIAVLVRPAADGELGPFDAAALEAALRVESAAVTAISMAPPMARETLEKLTRLGVSEVWHLADAAFAGADTLATSYVLALAAARLAPDLVFCGRKTLQGDTGQVGVGVATRLCCPFFGEVMDVKVSDETATVTTRAGEKRTTYPAVLSFERSFTLRLPSIRARRGTYRVFSAADLYADPARCGAAGSPTRVVRSFESTADRRKCTFIAPADFARVYAESLQKKAVPVSDIPENGAKLPNMLLVGDLVGTVAADVAISPRVVPLMPPAALAALIRETRPAAVLFDTTPAARETAAAVATLLGAGLCADCVRLETDGTQLFCYRPAFGGNITAKIAYRAAPALATVRTVTESGAAVLSLGRGARAAWRELCAFAKTLGAELAASRAAVDADLAPYAWQVGLTGKTVAPRVYVAVGISGAVHHVAGMRGAGTVIAVDPDPAAPIFQAADYGVIATAEAFLAAQK